MTTLWAWAVPSPENESPVDHTWVTTYDSRQHTFADIVSVEAAGEDYWYCWGVFHADGQHGHRPGGLLASQEADLTLATCYASGNDTHAHGTIFVYGVDGVCHQLANQILYATRGNGAPLTVEGARGYHLSRFVYGDYGLTHSAWASRMGGCARPVRDNQLKGVLRSPLPLDLFADHVRGRIPDDQALADRFLAFRGEVQHYAAQPIPGFVAPDAATLNARNQHLIDQAAMLLGPEKFEQVFEVPAGTKVDLVDPSITAAIGR